jgi:hypothetical protein
MKHHTRDRHWAISVQLAHVQVVPRKWAQLQGQALRNALSSTGHTKWFLWQASTKLGGVEQGPGKKPKPSQRPDSLY